MSDTYADIHPRDELLADMARLDRELAEALGEDEYRRLEDEARRQSEEQNR